MDGFRVGFETSYASHRCIRTLGTYSHRRRVLRAPTRASEPAEPRRTPWPRCTDSHSLMIGGKLPKPSTQFEFSLRWWNRGGELSCRDGIGISSRRRDGSTREASQENIPRPARLGVGTSVRGILYILSKVKYTFESIYIYRLSISLLKIRKYYTKVLSTFEGTFESK